MANLFTNSRLFIACAAASMPIVFLAMALLIRGMPTHREYSDLSEARLLGFARVGLGLLGLLGLGWCGLIFVWLK